MYRIMVRKQPRSGTVFLCLLLLAGPLCALEKSIELGKGNLWGEMQTLEGVSAVPGRWGFQDLALANGEYAPDSATELLLHFDAPGTTDATGSYALEGSPPSSRIRSRRWEEGAQPLRETRGGWASRHRRTRCSLPAPSGATSP